jgi:hypothetical protein
VPDSTSQNIRFQLDLLNLARGLDLGSDTGNAEASSLEGLLAVCARGRMEESRLICEPEVTI